MRRIVAVLILALLLAIPSAHAADAVSGVVAQERIDLFLASREMLLRERQPDHMRVGLVMANLNSGSFMDVGVKAEPNLNASGTVRLVTETFYLREDNTLAGFASLKFLPFADKSPIPVYFGAGAGYVKGLKYQLFAGVEVTKNFFAEVRYMNPPGGIGGKGLVLATGFQLTY